MSTVTQTKVIYLTGMEDGHPVNVMCFCEHILSIYISILLSIEGKVSSAER